MDCVCVKNLTNVPTEDFQNNYLTACKQDFQTRQLYSASRDEKFTDEWVLHVDCSRAAHENNRQAQLQMYAFTEASQSIFFILLVSDSLQYKTHRDLRKSMFRPIVDNTSFDLADSVISTSIKMINLTGSLYEGMMLLTWSMKIELLQEAQRLRTQVFPLAISWS